MWSRDPTVDTVVGHPHLPSMVNLSLTISPSEDYLSSRDHLREPTQDNPDSMTDWCEDLKAWPNLK